MRSLLLRLGSLIGLGLAGLLLAGSVATGQSPEPDLQAEGLAFFKAASDHLVDVQPGDILYIRTENYDRYGPKAEEIAKIRNLDTEQSVRETWYEIGMDRLVVRSASRVIDANGQVVQLDISENARLQAIDPQTDSLLADLENPDWPIDSLTQISVLYAGLVSNDAMAVTSVSDDRVTAETKSDLSGADDNSWQDDDKFQVPFYSDLGAETLILRHVIGADGVERLSESYAVTPNGEQVLVSSITMTDFRTVAQIPGDLLSASSTMESAEGEAAVLSAQTCYDPSPRECIDYHTNFLGGVSLEAFNITVLNSTPGDTGYWSYDGGAYSHASSSINSISVTGSGGHSCNGNTFNNTWYDSDSRSNANHAEAGGTTNWSAMNCISNWQNWTSASHNMVDDFFGWGPTTYAKIVCSGILC